MSLHAYLVVKKIKDSNMPEGFRFIPLLETVTQDAPKAIRFAHFIGSECAVVNCSISYSEPSCFPNSLLEDIGTDNNTGNVTIEKNAHKTGWHRAKTTGLLWYGSTNQKAAR